jgi:hypothetical protein
MAVFFLASKHSENDEAVKSRFDAWPSGDYYEMGRGQWLLAFEGTSKELYNKLFPDNTTELPKLGGVVILGISGYWGRASTDMWEWITAKKEAKSV